MTGETILTKWLSVSFINRTWWTKIKIFFIYCGKGKGVDKVSDHFMRWMPKTFVPLVNGYSFMQVGNYCRRRLHHDFGRVYTLFSHAPRNRTAPVIWSLTRKKEGWSLTKTWFWRVNWWADIRFFFYIRNIKSIM
jgi:hypothetical protein